MKKLNDDHQQFIEEIKELCAQHRRVSDLDQAAIMCQIVGWLTITGDIEGVSEFVSLNVNEGRDTAASALGFERIAVN